MSAYNGSRIAEGRTRTLDHAAPSSRDRARKLGTFPHQADIGVRGIGSTKVAAFKSAAHALTAVITDLGSVASTYSVRIFCEAPDDELLLVDWLNVLVYEMATHVFQADRKKRER